MSNTGRSIALLALFSASLIHSPSGAAQPTNAQSQVLSRSSRTRLDGRFAHYLMSDDGAINGIMLEDGTVARFSLFEPAPQTTFLRPGDAVSVEGDGLSSPTGLVLVNASVKIRSDTDAHVDLTPARSTAGSNSMPQPHARHPRKRALSQDKAQSPQPMAAASKTQQRDGRLDTSLFFGNSSVSAERKGYGESVWLKLKHVTTGAGQQDSDWHWRRSRETSGQ